MYQCRVEKRVWREADRSYGYTRLFFDLEIDAAPKLGCELHMGRWFSGPLNFVVWDKDEERFFCKVDDEYPMHDRHYDYTYEWIVENYLLQGWHARDA